eukprot:jgi/Psemu1/242051/estExt_Genewise1.C_2600003
MCYKGCCKGCCCRSGRRSMCLPYNDGHVITAQILSVFAFLVSWTWWLTFLLSGIAMILLQTLWCCRQSRVGILAMAVIPAIAAVSCLCSAIWMLVVWKYAGWCSVFSLQAYWGGYYSWLYCNEDAWATVALVDMVMWLAVSGCILRFVLCGSHAECERKLDEQQKQKRASGNPESYEGNNDSPPPEAVETAATAGVSFQQQTKPLLPIGAKYITPLGLDAV